MANMNNNVGVFHWIRESVRRAVLLGFSDAIEQIGAPNDRDALSPQLLAVLKEGESLAVEGPKGVPLNPGRGKAQAPKRLGRSLSQIQGDTAGAAG